MAIVFENNICHCHEKQSGEKAKNNRKQAGKQQKTTKLSSTQNINDSFW